MSGLEKAYPGKVVGQNVNAGTPESVTAVEALGFKNHGLVVRAPDGDALWSQPDHEVDMNDVRAALDRLIEERGL